MVFEEAPDVAVFVTFFLVASVHKRDRFASRRHSGVGDIGQIVSRKPSVPNPAKLGQQVSLKAGFAGVVVADKYVRPIGKNRVLSVD